MGKGRWAVALVAGAVLVVGAVAYAASQETSSASQGEQAPPKVAIVAPEADCTIRVGEVVKVLLMVNLEDVAAVAVLCDDKGVAMLNAAPYAFDWDTSGLAPGKHVLRAFVYLKGGEKVGAAPVMVSVVAGEGTSTSAPPTALPAVQPFTIREGTAVVLETLEGMTSGAVPRGSTVRYKAKEVLGPGGQVLIPYGANGYGKVTESRRRGMLGRQGRLSFTVEFVEAADGTQVPLRAKAGASGKGNQGVVAASVLILSVLAVFVHGRDVAVPAGTEITAYVDHDTAIGAPGAPRPGGVAIGKPADSVAIESPRAGRTAYRGTTVRVTLKVEPIDKVAVVTLLMNGRPVGEPFKDPATLVLDTKGFQPGEYSLQACVTFVTGAVVCSSPVAITIAERL